MQKYAIIELLSFYSRCLRNCVTFGYYSISRAFGFQGDCKIELKYCFIQVDSRSIRGKSSEFLIELATFAELFHLFDVNQEIIFQSFLLR